MDLPAKLLTGVVLVLALGLSFKAFGDDDNRISINQVAKGDDLDITILQEGYNNNIFFSIGDGDNIIFDLLQTGNNNEMGWVNDSPSWGSGASWGGDVDYDDQYLRLWQHCSETTCNKNDIQFHVSYGTDNTVWWGQGYFFDNRNDTSWTLDTYDKGGHKATLDIHGSNNSLKGFQRNCDLGTCDGHVANIYYYSDGNDGFFEQVNDGAKTLNVTTFVDGNIMDVEQFGHGEHTATIGLYGNYATDIDLIQKGNSDQTYSLIQNCQTVGGCTVNITQQ